MPHSSFSIHLSLQYISPHHPIHRDLPHLLFTAPALVSTSPPPPHPIRPFPPISPCRFSSSKFSPSRAMLRAVEVRWMLTISSSAFFSAPLPFPQEGHSHAHLERTVTDPSSFPVQAPHGLPQARSSFRLDNRSALPFPSFLILVCSSLVLSVVNICSLSSPLRARRRRAIERR